MNIPNKLNDMNKYSTNIKSNALHGISTGIDIATSVVKQTIGAKGKNVIIEASLPPYHILTNDGATIIDSIHLDDPLEKRGLAFLKEVVSRSNANSGDGSTTTCVLLDAILKEGIKTGVSSLEIKESLDDILPLIENLIHGQTKQITENEIRNVALIAGESEELADVLTEIYAKIGKDGIIHLENSGTYGTSYDFTEGVRFFDTGYLSSYMVYEEEKRKENKKAGREVQKETKAVYYNPTILVTKRKIGHLNDINPLLETLQKQGKKNLVIFTDDMDSGVASLLVKAHRAEVINCTIIKAPTLWKNLVFEDFAKITGSTIIEDASGISSFKDLPLSVLGTCGKIVIEKEEITVTGIADISDHINELKKDVALNQSNDSERRLSWLQTRTAILRIGAKSETELTWKKYKAEDAIRSCQLALRDGIVAGGGVCLLNVSKQMPDTIGGRILTEALQAPIKQIVENANGQMPQLKDNLGYNAKTGEVVDMFGAGIIDSATVVKMAVKNAIGVASTVLTASTLLTLPEKSKEQMVAEQLQGRTSVF